MENNVDLREGRDNQLFNDIASEYGRKDMVPSSAIARKFQLNSLMNLINDQFGKNKFETILEVGCGVGASSEYLRGLFENYIGIDYTKEFIELANRRYSKSNVEFHCLNIKELVTDRKPDLILGVGVLHHISDLKKAFYEMQKVADQDTIFAFIEPNSKNYVIQLLRNIRKRVDKAYSEDQIYFNKRELEELFLANGFTSIKTKYQGYFSPPLAQVILNPQLIFKPIAVVLSVFDKVLQRYFNLTISWNIMIVGKSEINSSPQTSHILQIVKS